MKAIVIAASKGGTGKTTLAAALAVEATRHGAVAIMDLDPQQSLARWHDLRLADDEDDVLDLIDPGKRPDVAIARAAKQKIDWLFIDTPGGSLTTMRTAIDAADLVLIPVRPSPLDVESMTAVVELCDRAGRPWAFVLNGVESGSAMADGARTYLRARFGNLLDEEVQHREVYASAMLGGATAPELNTRSAAASEIGHLWAKVAQLAANPVALLAGRRTRSAS